MKSKLLIVTLLLLILMGCDLYVLPISDDYISVAEYTALELTVLTDTRPDIADTIRGIITPQHAVYVVSDLLEYKRDTDSDDRYMSFSESFTKGVGSCEEYAMNAGCILKLLFDYDCMFIVGVNEDTENVHAYLEILVDDVPYVFDPQIGMSINPEEYGYVRAEEYPLSYIVYTMVLGN